MVSIKIIKNSAFKTFAFVTFLALGVTGCEKTDEVKDCLAQNNYIDTVSISGTAFLYINPNIETDPEIFLDNVIGFFTDNNSAFLSSNQSLLNYNSYRGQICNYNDHANGWQVSSSGVKVTYAGTLYITNEFPTSGFEGRGNIILSKLEKTE